MDIEKIKAAMQVINTELAKAETIQVKKKKNPIQQNHRIGKYQIMFNQKLIK